jgi:hypothetical protein
MWLIKLDCVELVVTLQADKRYIANLIETSSNFIKLPQSIYKCCCYNINIFE